MPSPSITLRGWDDGNFEKLLWLRRERIVIQAKISANAEKERERERHTDEHAIKFSGYAT